MAYDFQLLFLNNRCNAYSIKNSKENSPFKGIIQTINFAPETFTQLVSQSFQVLDKVMHFFSPIFSIGSCAPYIIFS